MIDKIIINSIRYIQNIKNTVTEVVEKSSSWAKAFSRDIDFFAGTTVRNPFKQIPTVFKAIRAINENISQADIYLRNKKSKEAIEDNDLINLLENPNPLQDGQLFLESLAGYYGLYGEFFIVKTLSIGQMAGTYKLPSELWVFNPMKFQEVINRETGELKGYNYNQTFFSKDEIIHSKSFNPESIYRGFSPLVPIDIVVDIDYKSMIFNRAFFNNAGTPALALSSDKSLTDQQANRLKVWINKEYRGASKAFKTLILESGLKAEQISQSHKDMDFIEQKKYTREEIYGMWRVPKSLHSITDGLNYSIGMQQQRLFWEATILPILQRITTAINRGLISSYNPSIELWFDVSNLPAFKEAFAEKLQSAKDLAFLGYPTNAINKKLQLGMQEYPWLETWYKPFNTIDVQEDIFTEKNMKAEEKKELPVKSASHKKENIAQVKNIHAWQKFVVYHTSIKIPFAKAIKTHFFNQRKKVLANISKSLATLNVKTLDIGIDWDEENKLLKNRVSPYIKLGIERGFKFAESFGLSIEDQMIIDTAMSSILSYQSQKITLINDTVRKQITKVISEGISEGQTIVAISDNIRKIYNIAGKRSTLIAITQTTAAINSGNQQYMKESGVKSKQWLTAEDEFVRESHMIINGEVKAIEKLFSNGLLHPGGEGSAEEVINCRCTEIPIFEEKQKKGGVL